MPSNQDVNEYLDYLLKEYGDARFVMSPPGKEVIYPWVQVFAWISSSFVYQPDSKRAEPTEEPRDNYQLYLCTRTTGVDDYKVQVGVRSERGGIAFDQGKEAVEQHFSLVAKADLGDDIPVDVSSKSTHVDVQGHQTEVLHLATEMKNLDKSLAAGRRAERLFYRLSED